MKRLAINEIDEKRERKENDFRAKTVLLFSWKYVHGRRGLLAGAPTAGFEVGWQCNATTKTPAQRTRTNCCFHPRPRGAHYPRLTKRSLGRARMVSNYLCDKILLKLD